MALRFEKTVGACLIFAAAAALADPAGVTARHRHLHGGADITLRVDAGSIAFEETKDKKHSRKWKLEDLQQVTLSRDVLRVLTYDDQKLQLGRDREYVFDQLPDGFANQVEPLLRNALGRRFIAALADPNDQPLWQAPAKLLRGLSGPQGTITIGQDCITYETSSKGESRTWLLADIDNVSSDSPFDLLIATLEHAGWTRSGATLFRFQLKEPLSE